MKDGKSYFIKHGTAHSLGGALMFYLAAKHHFPITTFSSADPRDRLNFEELAFINKHPEMFKDYYHLTDWVGDWQVMARLGNPKAVKEVFSKQAGITRFLGLNGHYLDSYAFSKSGDLFNDPIEELDDELESLDAEYERLKANNALTDAETVMLDASAAILLAKAIKSEANDGADEVISELNTLIKNANNYWKQTKSMCDNMSPDLSYDDVLNCLDRGGANYHTMVGTFKDKYDERIRKAKKIKNKFNDWYDQTTAGISKMVGDDQELAGMFKK
ncbi:hypothetical protein FC87_GL001273 [Fructilactobacillus florum DSM 22689 = JCM 16035]|uniref:Uncharacterized protein n=2 Tax=Fructilactobacillus florum TaxID=640331 RepID=A0A0R2CH05_9LACO|nr:hypothetical protein FC87_GL001273 [Fructilactobacillus florum DSM 22689 = JCM 16035]